MPIAAKAVQGFTLLELIIVLLISVLGFAVIGSNISSGNQSTRLKSAARDIASALRYAHGQALMARKPVSVAISLADNSYRISNRPKIYHLDTEIDISLTVAEEEFTEDQEGSIRFFGDGSSTGGRVILELGNLVQTIDVNWITGAVLISSTLKRRETEFTVYAGGDCRIENSPALTFKHSCDAAA